MKLVINLIKQNKKINCFAFGTIFVLTIVFNITLGARMGYDKIYQDVGKSDILVVYEGNVACPYTSLVPEKFGPLISKVPHVLDVAAEIRQRYSFEKHTNLTLSAMAPDKLLKFKDLDIDKKEFEAFKNNPRAALVKTNLTDPGALQSLMKRIEELCKDNPSKISCRPEDELWQAIQSSQGNLGSIITGLALSLGTLIIVLHINNAFFTLRYKLRSIGKLKTDGFPKKSVLAIIFSETALLLSLAGILASAIIYLALFKFI